MKFINFVVIPGGQSWSPDWGLRPMALTKGLDWRGGSNIRRLQNWRWVHGDGLRNKQSSRRLSSVINLAKTKRQRIVANSLRRFLWAAFYVKGFSFISLAHCVVSLQRKVYACLGITYFVHAWIARALRRTWSSSLSRYLMSVAWNAKRYKVIHVIMMVSHSIDTISYR
jgi:hypothetical protein